MQQHSGWLVIAESHAFLCCVKRSTSESVTMGVRKDGKWAFPPLEIWSKTKTFGKSENSSSISNFAVSV